MSMSKLFAVIIALAAANAAQAAPAQDEIDKLLHQKGLVARLGDSIQHATNRAADLVVNAMDAVGVPYRKGGNSADTGFDCSGFVRAMYQQTVGMILPRRAEEQAAATEQIEKAELQPGDLVFFNTMRRAYSHVGIYVGDGKFIHAPRTGAHVRVESMKVSYWEKRFNGARRVLDAAPQEQISTSRVTTRESVAPRSYRLGGTFSQPSVPATQLETKTALGQGI
ncbi:cell wall-associated NlpC family hydrolase [Ottowia thiooxydans]|uniref:Cell wall-associated NlpC family hydrolase n=2 Tax=Ottowia thiooxydans TaxID=219182 RepID=A0ABV2Q3S1_9BURK